MTLLVFHLERQCIENKRYQKNCNISEPQKVDNQNLEILQIVDFPMSPCYSVDYPYEENGIPLLMISIM